MVFKVALVGHSQIPNTITPLRNTEVRVFKRPGGSVFQFEEPPFSEVFDYRPDLVILFLGGNDVALYGDEHQRIVSKLKQILARLKELSNNVIFVTLERRNYPLNNRFGVVNEVYNRNRKKVNDKLRAFLRRKSIRQINVTAPWFSENLRSDGVHFNSSAAIEFRRKIILAIQSYNTAS